MAPSPLTVIAPLKSQDPQFLLDLEKLLARRGRHIFEGSPSTHFAAFVMLGDRNGKRRLFMSADHDGEVGSYLDELWNASPGTMDAIWSHCKDYPGRFGFHDFVKARSFRSQAYFTAFQDETAESIKAMAHTRERLEQALGDNAESTADLIGAIRGSQGRAGILERIGMALSALVAGLRARVKQAFWSRVIKLAQAYGERIVKDLPISAASDIGQTLDPTLDLRYQRVQTGQAQNQMTNISWVTPGRGLLLRLGLWTTNTMAKYAFPPGDLAGVKTVHCARWAVIDGGRGLLFEGNFDGTWENYMGEFADRIAWGLDAVWGNTDTYPPAGMRDIWAFKRYIRDLQYPPAMTYMAYPQLSVMNTMRDREIHDALDSRDPGAVERVIAAL